MIILHSIFSSFFLSLIELGGGGGVGGIRKEFSDTICMADFHHTNTEVRQKFRVRVRHNDELCYVSEFRHIKMILSPLRERHHSTFGRYLSMDVHSPFFWRHCSVTTNFWAKLRTKQTMGDNQHGYSNKDQSILR